MIEEVVSAEEIAAAPMEAATVVEEKADEAEVKDFDDGEKSEDVKDAEDKLKAEDNEEDLFDISKPTDSTYVPRKISNIKNQIELLAKADHEAGSKQM